MKRLKTTPKKEKATDNHLQKLLADKINQRIKKWPKTKTKVVAMLIIAIGCLYFLFSFIFRPFKNTAHFHRISTPVLTPSIDSNAIKANSLLDTSNQKMYDNTQN